MKTASSVFSRRASVLRPPSSVLCLSVLCALFSVLRPLASAASSSSSPSAASSLTVSGTNTFLTGSTTTFNSGSNLTVSGSFGGAPTGGTLNLSALTLTLPTSQAFTTPNIGAATGTSLNLGATGAITGLATATQARDVQAASTTLVPSVASMQAAIAPLRNALAPRQGLVFDGTVGISGIANIPAFRTSDFTVAFWFRPDSLPAYSTICYGGVGVFYLYVQANGSVVVQKAGGATALTTSAGTVVAGEEHLWTLSRTGGTLTLRKDSVSVDSAADANDYTGVITTIGTTSTTTEVPVGRLRVLIYNRALSAAEVLALYESGAPAAADYNNASNTSIVTGDNSTFASDTGFWDLNNVTISGGKVNFTPGSNRYIRKPSLLTQGKRYRVTFTIADYVAGGVVVYAEPTGTYHAAYSGNGTYTLEFVAASVADNFYFLNSDSAADLAIDDVAIVPIGLLCAPESNAPGNGLVWNDQSGNGAHIVLPTSGVAWNLPSNGTNHIRGTTSTNGNQQLLGASVLLPANKLLVLRVRARSRTGTPTVTLGNGSGLGNIVASVALSTTWQTLTLAATDFFPTTDSPLWAGSNSTDVVEWDIAVEPLSF